MKIRRCCAMLKDQASARSPIREDTDQYGSNVDLPASISLTMATPRAWSQTRTRIMRSVSKARHISDGKTCGQYARVCGRRKSCQGSKLIDSVFCSALSTTIVANLQLEIGSHFKAGALVSYTPSQTISSSHRHRGLGRRSCWVWQAFRHCAGDCPRLSGAKGHSC